MGDDTIDNVQMELQMWSVDLSSDRVCSADSPLLGRRRRTCTLETVMAGYPPGRVVCSVHA